MRLPNGENATIDRRKLVDYVLCTEHDDGKHKARVFRELLGIEIDQADDLINGLRNAVLREDAVVGRNDRYGQRYIVDFDYTGPKGTATIRSVWIIRPENAIPGLVTCYIL